MLTNYIVRNNCFRVKKGNQPKHPEIIAEVEQLKGKFAWADFADVWDVVVKNNKIVVFESVKDISAVSEVCAKRAMIEELNIAREWSPQEDAVIHMIECQFLDGKMSWKNYKKAWKVSWNDEQKRIVTELLKLPKTQTPVTQEMIDKKLAEQLTQSSSGSNLTARPMSADEIKHYREMLVNKSNTQR